MSRMLLLFLAVFFLNLVPAFAPPTWMVFSYLGFRSPSLNLPLLGAIGAAAATSGRLVLAKLSDRIVRRKFLSEASKRNIDVLRERLERRRKLTFSIFLFYAFSPLPSNYLFISYGLTTMDLRLVAIPFFLGRWVSYTFWGFTSATVARRIAVGSTDALSYLSWYFIGSQTLILCLIYLFTRIDWQHLLTHKRLRLVPRGEKAPALPDGR
ncbi:MAG: hypothetical protein LAN36_11955 [Acidobacteriia bacterium]|nr:hypothetical protein [Terriglobia bacterium]